MHETYLIFCAHEWLVRRESPNRFALETLKEFVFKVTIRLISCLSPFGNWSGRYIQRSILTLLGKDFNMAYGVLMLKPRSITELYEVGC